MKLRLFAIALPQSWPSLKPYTGTYATTSRPKFTIKRINIMRINLAILLLMAAFLQVSAKSNAQKITLQEKNVPMEKVFQAIEKQTGYVFVYDSEELRQAVVSIALKNASIDKAVKECLKERPFSFKIVDNNILIKRESRPVVAVTQQPNQEIKGVVKDDKGEVLVGASVKIKGTNTTVVTDNNGAFRIDAEPGQVLVVSYIGYQTTEVTVNSANDLAITLAQTNSKLGEVVVVGYGTQSRRTVTSAVSKIDGKQLENRPVNSVGDALKGKVAGLRVYTTDFQPGENPTFRIRGGSSINKSDAPITVIDGVVREISGLNPADIESIEVLKDAASAAIYGAKASNGIVLITTKKGALNRAPTITFESSTAYQQPAQQFDLMNAEDYLYYMRTAIARGKFPQRNAANGFSASSGNTETSMWTTRYLRDGETIPSGWKSMADPLDPTKTLIFEDNDYQARFFKPSWWQNYYLGATGGTQNIRYAASAGYTKDDGVGIGTGYSRFTMRGNIDFAINKKLSFNTGFDYSGVEMEDYDDNKRNVLHRGLSTPATHRVYNSETGLPERGYNGTTPAPDWYDYYYDRGSRTKRYTAFGQLTYKVTNDLKAIAMLTSFNRHTRSHTFVKANEYNGLRPTEEAFSETQRLDFQYYLNYNRNFGKGHSFGATVGSDYLKDDLNGFGASVTGASSDKVPTLSAGSVPGNPTSEVSKEVLISYFGRFNYDFRKKYLLSLTLRADGSSKFAPESRWGYFPAVSAGWVLSEEEFMAGLKSLSTLKLRASYGQTGNNSIGLYDAYGNYSTNGKYSGNATIVTSTIPNNALKWETTNQLDIGLDLGLFNDRITLHADYFNKITRDLIFNQPLPNSSGYSSITTNVGKVKFYGGEFAISSQNIKSKNFSWTTDLTYSYIMNRVLELPYNGRDKNRIGGITLGDGSSFGGIAEGERMYGIYGYVVSHILETQEAADAAMYDANSNGFRFSDGRNVAGRKDVGDYEWVNRPGSTQRNGKDQITSEDQFLLGYTIPHTTGGIGNNFTYKNLSLNIFMDYMIGHTVQNYLQERYFMGTFNYNYNLTNEVKKAWTKPGDDTKYAKFFANDADDGSRNYSRVSNIFSEKGDFLCIREVILSYKLPSRLYSRFNIKDLSVYASGNNLHYFTEVTGVPPERGTGDTYATDYSPYPAPRKFAVGVKLTL